MTSNAANLNLARATWRIGKLQTALWVVVGLVLMLGVIFLATPPGRRWLARPAEVAPLSDVTTVEVLADPSLNHVFAPAAIRVPAGTTVTWQFADIDADGQYVEHNVRFSDGGGSKVLTQGEFSRRFDEAGDYTYVCTLHAYMAGRVLVEAVE